MKQRQFIDIALSQLISNIKTYDIPFDFTQIIDAYPNIKINTFSNLIKDTNISYSTLIKYNSTKEALVIKKQNTNKHLIYYNNIDKSFVKSNRYRFSIAHEIGHIFLDHFSNDTNNINDETYSELETEANKFASKLLCPFISFKIYDIKNIEDIEQTFKVSKQFAEIAFENYQKWLYNRRLSNIKSLKYQHIARNKFDLSIYNKLNIKNSSQNISYNRLTNDFFAYITT